jgi:tryptophan 2,3-dioxygenase
MANQFKNPILEGKGATDYERYLRTDELLSLQTVTSKLSHPDELTFQVVHQSSELLMKGACWELERARVALGEGNYPNSARLMRRANAMFEHPISLLRILETITPYDYHVIRSGLGHGSGLESPGFLSLLHIAPRIGDAFQEQLASQGLFRLLHLKLVQRIIGGGVIGTGGTPVEVLQQRMQHVAYRELWDLRNKITADVNTSS